MIVHVYFSQTRIDMGLSTSSRVQLCSAVKILSYYRVYTFMILNIMKTRTKVLGSLIYLLVFLYSMVSIIAEKYSFTDL